MPWRPNAGLRLSDDHLFLSDCYNNKIALTILPFYIVHCLVTNNSVCFKNNDNFFALEISIGFREARVERNGGDDDDGCYSNIMVMVVIWKLQIPLSCDVFFIDIVCERKIIITAFSCFDWFLCRVFESERIAKKGKSSSSAAVVVQPRKGHQRLSHGEHENVWFITIFLRECQAFFKSFDLMYSLEIIMTGALKWVYEYVQGNEEIYFYIEIKENPK